MTRRQRFGFSIEVSLEFSAQEPALAQRWIDARRDEFAKQEFAKGPRGGTYRLDTPPDEWRRVTSAFLPSETAYYVTKRYGRYVRPGRVHFRSQSIIFGTLNIPVKDGKAMLPDGRVIQSESKVLVVPIPPVFDE